MSNRTQACDKAQARARLEHARAYLDVAEMVAEDQTDEALRGVAAGLAVLAGIAAADAACCHELGKRSRSQNHRDAVDLVESIGGGDARQASNALRRLIDLKDQSHYGFTSVSAANRGSAVKNAQKLVSFAENTAL